jgi:hypothetical protein
MSDILDEGTGLILNEDGGVYGSTYTAVYAGASLLDESLSFIPSAGAGVELPYASAGRANDDTTLANDIQITRPGGTLQEATAPGSIATYLFPRTYDRSDVLLLSDAESLAYAQWVLYISETTEDRFETLTLLPGRDPPDLWPQALGRAIGDRIQIWRRPPGSTTITRDCFIRGMTHTFDASARTWQTDFTLQDANRYSGFLVLDSATSGLLDSQNLAY